MRPQNTILTCSKLILLYVAWSCSRRRVGNKISRYSVCSLPFWNRS